MNAKTTNTAEHQRAKTGRRTQDSPENWREIGAQVRWIVE